MQRGVMFQYFEWNYPNDGRLWRELEGRAIELKNLGTTAVWLPPANKALGGIDNTGYAVYDLYDLGEFDQKGTVRTKYGTAQEYLAAIKAVREAGMQVYADVVLNHRMGGDALEEVEVVEINPDDRNQPASDPYKIKAWSHYSFPGRQGKYSAFQWHWQHFTGFGCDANHPDAKKIYRVKDKTFSGEVSFEFGNFDYLMGADVDCYHPDVRAELLHWGKWFVEHTGIDGFRLDAVKHIPASFYKEWFQQLRSHFKGRELYGVGEYWSQDLEELRKYTADTEGVMDLFDVPLHYNFHRASEQGKGFDLRTIFDGSLISVDPTHAVTFVDNHDSQPGQSLQSVVDDWFKPLAYALIVLRERGYPCIFYGDYFGNPSEENKLVRHRKLIDDFLTARRELTFGDCHDYFDHPNCIGWVWTGTADNPQGMVVLMSNGENGVKTMKTFKPQTTFRDITGHWPEPVTTDENGEGEFHCLAGKVSVWRTISLPT